MHLLVNIDVDDLGRVLDFYSRAFDLVVADIDSALEKALQAGATLEKPTRSSA